MSVPVKLSEIVDGMEFQTNELSNYLNRKTGEVFPIGDEEFSAAEEGDSLEDCPEWQQEVIEVARAILDDEKGETYIELPSKFDIHEYGIMEEFCLSISDEKISESLYRAIKGRGAFGRFKDGIHRFGVAEDWYEYRDEALKKIAKEWCEANNVEYIDD
ncbi:MAG: hypothetical protein GTO12_24570 [Proteobacteria bacterium]|nr:hypothetical protein [Pseudomonadota bacterium]